ncbi:MAG: hypothetical protein ACT4O5_09855 [Gammaproteobacteria bacterium]
MILRQLQELIGGIYDVSLAHDVYDFLCTDRASLPAASRAASDEQLIVAHESDAIGVSLYLDPALLERLRKADPIRRLDAGNVADYCTALEGVSHFVYFAWNAGHDKGVSLLELELQAEIDKYVASCWLLRRQFPDRYPAELLRVLFERARIDPALAGERANLYRAASRYAERFCRRIERALREGRAEPEREVLAELRRFYRLTDAHKRAHIEKMG